MSHWAFVDFLVIRPLYRHAVALLASLPSDRVDGHQKAPSRMISDIEWGF